ncbi:MAG: class I SAM-dependent methyltransferase [Pseudomonadales bacterium]|nr:class I SAM-dependent methyltransferase [Pseudomonadales bacterium]
MSDRLSTDQWSRYWEKGTITTFHGRFGENYDGPVRDFWHGLFATLPGDARIVDLATGNGAVALLAAQYSHRQGRAFDIVGVDTAEIDPARLFAGKAYARHLRRIRFLARTPVGATTLPDSSQDLATSQFGIEYAETAATVAEVGRILKPQNATFAAMIHHADSAIVRQAKRVLNPACTTRSGSSMRDWTSSPAAARIPNTMIEPRRNVQRSTNASAHSIVRARDFAIPGRSCTTWKTPWRHSTPTSRPGCQSSRSSRCCGK